MPYFLVLILFILITWSTIKVNEQREKARSAQLDYHKSTALPENYLSRGVQQVRPPSYEELQKRAQPKRKKKLLEEASQELRKVFEEIKLELDTPQKKTK